MNLILDAMPRLNFAFHCTTPISQDYPSLLRCPELEDAIRVCHQNRKKVYIALGGDVGPYGFQSVEEAKLLAYRVYHLFLSGTDLEELRPFGRYGRLFYCFSCKIGSFVLFNACFSDKIKS